MLEPENKFNECTIEESKCNLYQLCKNQVVTYKIYVVYSWSFGNRLIVNEASKSFNPLIVSCVLCAVCCLLTEHLSG